MSWHDWEKIPEKCDECDNKTEYYYENERGILFKKEERRFLCRKCLLKKIKNWKSD